MCGIYFSCDREKNTNHCDNSLGFLNRRGPDSFKSVHREAKGGLIDTSLSDESCVLYLTFIATVLSLRGDFNVEQPLEDKQSGSILCWNGEAWQIDCTPIVGNDAVAVFNLLVKAVSFRCSSSREDISSEEEASQAVLGVLSTIRGPRAFVFYDAQYQRIFYGRDALGRRSLLHKIDGSGSLMISSVIDYADTQDWAEVESGCIYRYQIGSKAGSHQNSINDSSAGKMVNHAPINTRCQASIDLLEKLHFLVRSLLTDLLFFLC